MPSVQEVLLEDLGETLRSKDWATSNLYFIGDVGGTNARLGFGRLDPKETTSPFNSISHHHHEHLAKSNDKQNCVFVVFVRFIMTDKDIEQVKCFFEDILAHLDGAVTQRIVCGSISVPGPVHQGSVAGPFNNLKGMARLREYPPQLFPPGRCALLNDMEAGAYGVLAVCEAPTSHFDQYFKVMWEGTLWSELKSSIAEPPGKGKGNPDTSEKNGPILTQRPMWPHFSIGGGIGCGHCLVIAPGTGLGSALITYHPTTQRYQVLPLELGSVSVSRYVAQDDGSVEAVVKDAVSELSLPAPLSTKFLESFANFLKCKPSDIKIEDTVCEKSLVYYYLRGVGLTSPDTGVDSVNAAAMTYTPEYIVSKAQAGDIPALCAVIAAYTHLFRACSDAVMMFLPLTCAIIGSNIVRNSFIFDQDAFLDHFHKTVRKHPMEKGGFIGRTTFLRQIEDINLNLIGCLGFGWFIV